MCGLDSLEEKKDFREGVHWGVGYDASLPGQEDGITPITDQSPGQEGQLYLQFQVCVNLWPQEAEEIGCSGELESWNQIRRTSYPRSPLPLPPLLKDSPGMISSVTAAPPITWRLSKTTVFTPNLWRYAACGDREPVLDPLC